MLRRIATEPNAFGFTEERTIGGYIAAWGQGPTRKRAHDTLAYISMCVRLRVFYLARVLYSRTEQHMPPVSVYSLHRGRGRARASENSGVARQRTNPALNLCVVVFVFFSVCFAVRVFGNNSRKHEHGASASSVCLRVCVCVLLPCECVARPHAFTGRISFLSLPSGEADKSEGRERDP